MQLKFDLIGFNSLDRTLIELGPRVARNIVMKGLRAAGRVVVNAARKRVPVDTGNLRKSINTRARRAKNDTAILEVGHTTGQKASYDGFYAHMIEFGTSKMAARPYFRPAFDESREPAIQAMADKIGPDIEKEAIKLFKAG